MLRKYEIDKYKEENTENQLSHYVEITTVSILINYLLIFFYLLVSYILYGDIYKIFWNTFFATKMVPWTYFIPLNI